MIQNYFIQDSKYFFKKASEKIIQDIETNDLIQIVFNMALGVERLLKGVLYDINPIYVLTAPDFMNSFPTLYKEKIINICKDEKIISIKPNENVITYRQSLIRAQIVSKVTYENKTTLYKLGEYRDIIAHCNLAIIDNEDLRIFIYREFYPLVSSFCEELKIPKTHFFDNSGIRIARISSSFQNEKEIQLRLLIEASVGSWLLKKDDAELIKMYKKQTEKLLEDKDNYKIICPACGNDSILFTDPVYEYINELGKEVQSDFIPKFFVCRFCHLRLEDVSLIDDIIIPIMNDLEQVEDI